MFAVAAPSVRAVLAISALGVLVASGSALAAPAATADKRAFAVRTTAAPAIDGDLSDPVWRKAQFLDDFRQREPNEGAPASRRTEIAFAYDDEALYIGARLWAESRDQVQAILTGRDDSGVAERLIVSVDPYRHGRTAYSFAVTAAGVRVDWYHPEDGSFPRDYSFNPVWDAEAVVHARGWTAEMRIPFTQLRFPERDPNRWGVNINRFMPDRNEDVFWIAVPRQESAWASQFGELRGLRGIESPLRLELLPYVTGSAALVRSSTIEDGDPFTDPVTLDGRAGLDARLGIGPSTTVEATIYPDFGQVEADPAVVNLGAFEVFFPERRPFFIEGADLLQGRGADYYFSRRIGGPPRRTLSADRVSTPTATDLLGAVKWVSRFPSGVSVGALSALTGASDAMTYDEEAGQLSKEPVDALTSYNLVRVQRELTPGSLVGATATTVLRDLDPSSDLGMALASRAITAGSDLTLRWGRGRYQLDADVGVSDVAGTTEAITAIQESSAHFFQRPDQSHARFDPTRNHLFGWRAAAQLQKVGGPWRLAVGSSWESPGFELNDMGRLTSADDGELFGRIAYRDTSAGLFQEWEVGMRVEQPTNFGLDRLPTVVDGWVSLTLPNFWRTDFGGFVGSAGLSDSLTRGGPLMGVAPIWGVDGRLQNSFGARTRWQLALSYRDTETGLSGWDASGELVVHIVDRLRISLTPRLRHQTNSRQYLDTIDGGGSATFGKRYVFATIDRTEVAVQSRIALPITPTLSFELYAEPFTSSGRYHSFGELAAPRSRNLRSYGSAGATMERNGSDYAVEVDGQRFPLDDPDFTVLSLRSTAVLRWEFTPGSTLLLLWQQQRQDDLDRARDLSPEAFGDAFTAAGRNTIALKLSYWLPI